MKANDFNLQDENGKLHRLADYSGSWVVIYFYPKDDTPGCTKEACGFRDNLAELRKLGVVILGISKDSVVSHKKFSEKYKLNFPLLSNESTNTIRAYDAWGKKKFLGHEFEGIIRKTYLINPEGEVKKIYENVRPAEHAEEILHDITIFDQDT
jgi:thioredoxin-dependent peroxiredoxin